MAGPMRHSLIGASGAKRWLTCPASVPETQKLIDAGWEGSTSPAAERGTAVHEIGEMCVLQGRDPQSFAGEYVNDILVDQDMVAGAEAYVAEVEALRAAHPEMEVKIEEELDLSFDIGEGAFGTADIALVEPFSTGYLRDYKNGRTLVEASIPAESLIHDQDILGGRTSVANPQLAYYGLGLASRYSLDSIDAGIIQPNAPHDEGLVRSYFIDEQELITWAMVFQAGVARTKAKRPIFHPTEDNCHFCPVKGNCPGRNRKREADLQGMFQPIGEEKSASISVRKKMPTKTPSAKELTPRQLAQIVTEGPKMITYIQDLISYAEEFAIKMGRVNEMPGMKVIKGRKGSRQWVSPSDAIARMKRLGMSEDQIFGKKILSPTQVQKTSPDRYCDLEDIITQPDGKLKLVPESAKGDAVDVEMFKPIPENEQ